MTFEQMLANFIGRIIEVTLTNDLLTGTLLAVDSASLTLQTTPVPYYGPETQIVVFFDRIDYVQVPII